MTIKLNNFFTNNEIFTIKKYLSSIDSSMDDKLDNDLATLLLKDARSNNEGAQLSILYFTFPIIRKIIDQFSTFIQNDDVDLEDFKSWAYIALCDTDTISGNKARATKDDVANPNYNGIKISVLDDPKVCNIPTLLLNMKSKLQDVVGFNLKKISSHGVTDLDKNTKFYSASADRSKEINNTNEDIDYTYNYTGLDYIDKDYADQQNYVSNIKNNWQKDDDLVVLFNLLISDEMFEGNSKGLTPIVVLKALFNVLCQEPGSDKKLSDSTISKEIANIMGVSGTVQPLTWKPYFNFITEVADYQLDLSQAELIQVLKSLSYKYKAEELINFIDENSI